MHTITRETLIALGVPADVQTSIGADDDVSLAARLAGHDWYYYSDPDQKVFKRGEDALKKIVVELNKLPIEQARALWSEYAPPRFVFPGEPV